MPRLKRSRVVAFGVVLFCLAIESVTLFDRSGGEPRNRDVRRYVLGEVFDQYVLEQRFVVKSDGLSSITIHPRPASASPTGNVSLSLYQLGGDDQKNLVHRETMALVSMAQADAVTLRFPPQASKYRTYALDVTVEGSSDGQGIGVLAARGEGYRGATLLINGRPNYGDLVFETTVDGARTNFGAMVAQLARSGIAAPSAVLVLLLAFKYLALTAVVGAFMRGIDAAARTPQSPPSLPAS